MQLYGKGLLMTFTEVPSQIEQDFNEWYNNEHLDERINIPGFRRARRYEAIDADIKYLTTYEALNSDNIASKDYLDVLKKPSELSQIIMPQFTKWHRMTCNVLVDQTHGMGSALTLVRFFPDPNKVVMLLNWLKNRTLEELNKSQGITGSCVASVDLEADKRLANAFNQISDPKQNIEWAILIEGTNAKITETISRNYLSHYLDSIIIYKTKVIFEQYGFMYGNLRSNDNVIA
jgi:hypothetical protein|tara:strand:- start:348 stop:1046 length:699 start_codon:yes stop_codon:yes gene_type:complete